MQIFVSKFFIRKFYPLLKKIIKKNSYAFLIFLPSLIIFILFPIFSFKKIFSFDTHLTSLLPHIPNSAHTHTSSKAPGFNTKFTFIVIWWWGLFCEYTGTKTNKRETQTHTVRNCTNRHPDKLGLKLNGNDNKIGCFNVTNERMWWK